MKTRSTNLKENGAVGATLTPSPIKKGKRKPDEEEVATGTEGNVSGIKITAKTNPRMLEAVLTSTGAKEDSFKPDEDDKGEPTKEKEGGSDITKKRKVLKLPVKMQVDKKEEIDLSNKEAEDEEMEESKDDNNEIVKIDLTDESKDGKAEAPKSRTGGNKCNEGGNGKEQKQKGDDKKQKGKTGEDKGGEGKQGNGEGSNKNTEENNRKKTKNNTNKKETTKKEENGKEDMIFLFDKEAIKKMAEEKPSILLRYIGKWQAKATITKNQAEDLEDRLNSVTFDELQEEKMKEEINGMLECTNESIANIQEFIELAYKYYDEFGPFKYINTNETVKTFPIKIVHDGNEHIYGGLSRGDHLRVCLAHNCTTGHHRKNCFGLKMANALYLATAGKLCYPVPIAHINNLSLKAYKMLHEKKLTTKQASEIRKEVICGTKDENDEFLEKFFNEQIETEEEAEAEIVKVVKEAGDKKTSNKKEAGDKKETSKGTSNDNNNKQSYLKVLLNRKITKIPRIIYGAHTRDLPLRLNVVYYI